MATKNVVIQNNICLVVTGIGVGLLIGLAVSPILHIVVGSLITLIAGIVGALVGLKFELSGKRPDMEQGDPIYRDTMNITPMPLMILIVGIVLGAFSGIYIRTNDLFGTDLKVVITKWKNIGVDEKIISQRLFDNRYPPLEVNKEPNSLDSPTKQNKDTPSALDAAISSQEALHAKENKTSEKSSKQSSKDNSSEVKASPYTTGLFSVSVSDCERLRLKHGNELRSHLRLIGDARINKAIARCNNNESCFEGIKELLCSQVK